jgi:hypothetical protein
MGTKRIGLSAIFGLVGGAFILAFIWVPSVGLVLFVYPPAIEVGSLWALAGWGSLPVGLSLATLLFFMSRSPRKWAAWSSSVIGILMIAGSLAMVIYNIWPAKAWSVGTVGVDFLWPAIVMLALVGICYLISGILRITQFKEG